MLPAHGLVCDYQGLSSGGVVADCIQMIDGDFKVLLDRLDELGLREATIAIFAGDNGSPTLLNMIGNKEGVPADRVIDGCNQSALVIGKQEHSNRNYFPMFF